MNEGDPRIYVPPVEKDEAAQLMHYNWGEFMDEISPYLPPLFEIDPLTGDKEEEENDKTIARCDKRGRGREPWEWSEACVVIDNVRHLCHSPS